MSNFWKDRHEIHPCEQITGTFGGDGFAQVCGLLDEDPDLRRTTFRSDDDEQVLFEVRFAISVPSITPEPQQCQAVGELAECIGKLKKGRRLRVIGRYKYASSQVLVHAATKKRGMR
jgi:hypothetical protein